MLGYEASKDLFISTHSLTKRLTEIPVYYWEKESISTHSLTKRLTGTGRRYDCTGSISTHSLTKRLTTLRGYNRLRTLVFQLTASRRG